MPFAGHLSFVEQVSFPGHPKQELANVSWSTVADELRRGEISFMPVEVYLTRGPRLSYVNTGSTPGNAARHWVEAETQLPVEDKLARVHSLHKNSPNNAYRRLIK